MTEKLTQPGFTAFRAADIPKLLGFTALYALFGKACLSLFVAIDITPIAAWPGSGIAVAALLIGGRPYVSAIFAATWLGSLWLGNPAGTAAAIAAGVTLEAFCILRLLESGRHFDPNLGKLDDFIHLLLAGSVGALLGAGFGIGILWATDQLTACMHHGPVGQFAIWWMVDVLGILLITPLILVWRYPPEWRARGRLGEALLMLGTAFLVGQAIFLDWFQPLLGPVMRGYWMFLFSIWAATRLGAHGVLVLLLLVAVQGFTGAYQGVGFFANDIVQSHLAAYWGYLLVLTLTGMALTTYFNSQRRARWALQTAEADLRREHQLLEKKVRERTDLLATSEARTRAILRTMLDGVIHTDDHGTMLSVNEAVAAMFGYEEHELLGESISLLMPEPTRSLHAGYMQRFLETRHPTIVGHRTEVTGQRKDGTAFPLELAVNALVDDAGTTFIGVLSDISERKAAEATRENVRLEAERLMRMKSEFLANMSHEIRTPLGAVMGLARIGIRENAGRKAHDTCGRILTAGQHLLTVVNDILDFSKIEAGKLSIDTHPLQLAAVIDEALQMVAEQASAKGLALHSRLGADLPAWVLGDALRIRQILVNLLSNAIKFTAQGRVDLTVLRDGEQVWFAVRDEGIGMNADQLARIFKPFEQADSSTTRKFGGSGLGLAISLNLASLMGGDIQVVSTPGQGSTFTLRLTLPATAAQPEATEKSVLAGRPLTGLHVLAAEDVEVNRLILEDILDEAGATCVFAENGRLAVEQVATYPAATFDIVLMDVQMPEMDGHEATRRIRALAPDLPVIGLTAHAMAEARRKCLDSGMVDHVTKPVDPAALIGAILRQVRPREAAPETAAPPTPTAPTTTAVLPAPTFAMIDRSALADRFNGKAAFIRRLAQAALNDHADAPVKLHRLAEAGDFAALAFLAHSLKGLAGNLSAATVQAQAAHLERLARDQDPEALPLAPQLAAELALMLEELQALSLED